MVKNECGRPMFVRGIQAQGNLACNLPDAPNNCQKVDAKGQLVLKGNEGWHSAVDAKGKAIAATALGFSYANEKGTAPDLLTVPKKGDSFFVQRLEFQTCDLGSANFDSQTSFSFPISFAFKKDGTFAQQCPKANGNVQGTQSNAGHPDKCAFDTNKCPEKPLAYKVKLAPGQDAPYWCISPDRFRNAISEQMDNPKAEECAKDPKQFGWTSHGEIGANHSFCESQEPAMKLAYKQVDPGLKRGVMSYDENDHEIQCDDQTCEYFATASGAKEYQRAVNQACQNQPPTQVLQGSVTSGLKLGSDVPCPGGGDTTPNCVDKRGYRTAAANYLDHAVTYEADGRGMWSGLGVSKRGLMMAGTVGIECGPGEFDAIEVTLCAA